MQSIQAVSMFLFHINSTPHVPLAPSWSPGDRKHKMTDKSHTYYNICFYSSLEITMETGFFT